MKYYEIKNTKTQGTAQMTAQNFATACKQVGWRPRECRCVWAASAENAGASADY